METGPALWLAFLALGAVGLYFVLPGGRPEAAKAALPVLAAALGVTVYSIASYFAGKESMTVQAILAAIGLTAAVRVISHKKPVYCALYFILVVISTAGMALMAQAEFLAAALMIVYGGAILVTYVFVIMLAQQTGGPPGYDRMAREPFFAVAAGFVILAVLADPIFKSVTAPGGVGSSVGVDAAAATGTVSRVGALLLSKYAVGVQMAALLLLAAMIGAIAVARRKATPDGEPEPD
ncbi:MAG: NADH-quinone oxidoreductase subunit J [Phycisphaerales bacterium]|nr:NADH-quinone oxidoreductase subunit J [Phycisphaerales bacterium]